MIGCNAILRASHAISRNCRAQTRLVSILSPSSSIVDQNKKNNDNQYHSLASKIRSFSSLHHDSQGQATFEQATSLFNDKDMDPPRTSVLMELDDRVGILHDVLKYFWKYDINITRIESRPMTMKTNGKGNNSNDSTTQSFDFFIDFDGTTETKPEVQKLLEELGSQDSVSKLLILDEKEVQWFPRHISELDKIANRTLDAGIDLQSDHPGFNDIEYRSRRDHLSVLASNYRYNHKIPYINYTQDEVNTWSTVWNVLEPLWEKYACKEYKHSMSLLKENCGYSRDNIPQQQDISEYVESLTQFKMRPVTGLLSSRDFLNGLAFRIFFCTQYIRHHSKPLYTPEPDICHELLGHVPMFLNHDFADFSQEIGLASLGASDEDIDKLAKCYWHSVEFGLCKEYDAKSNQIVNKAYGAGLLSSFGELEYACGDGTDQDSRPEIKEWDPNVASYQEFPITTYQPIYFCATSLNEGKKQMREYCENLPRPFFAHYNSQNKTIHIDRPVKRTINMPAEDSDDEACA